MKNSSLYWTQDQPMLSATSMVPTFHGTPSPGSGHPTTFRRMTIKTEFAVPSMASTSSSTDRSLCLEASTYNAGSEFQMVPSVQRQAEVYDENSLGKSISTIKLSLFLVLTRIFEHKNLEY